jgi:hypothetical protein
MHLSEEEKMAALREAAIATLKEKQRRQGDLQKVAQTAQAVFWGLVQAPTMYVHETQLPEGASAPVEELWSVTPKVTKL